MERWFKNSKRLMAYLGMVAFLMVAGWQFGVGGTDTVFSETEFALENAVAGSAVAHDCKYTGDTDDKYRYGNYLISKCIKKTTIMEASTCGYTP